MLARQDNGYYVKSRSANVGLRRRGLGARTLSPPARVRLADVALSRLSQPEVALGFGNIPRIRWFIRSKKARSKPS